MRTWSKIVVGIGFLACALCPGRGMAAVSLPEGYKALDWIQSTGRQYIRTGVFGLTSTRVEAEFSHLVESPRSSLFGETWSDGAFLLCTQSKNIQFWSTGLNLLPFTAYDPQARYTFTFNGEKAILKQGETEVANMNATKVSTRFTSEVMVFGHGVASDCAVFRLYRLKLMNSTAAQSRDFVPCRNPAGEAGLYDLLNGRFYGNLGTADAFIGSDQSEAVKLNWIQSDGTQYVVTDIQGQPSSAVDFTFSHATYKTHTVFFGEDRWADRSFLFCLQDSGSTHWLQFWADQVNLLDNNQYDGTAKYDFHLGAGKVSLTKQGASRVDMNAVNICTRPTNKRIALFGLNDGTSLGKFRFHGMKVWASEGGALQADLVPYRKNGDIGVGNVAGGAEAAFFKNSGTNAFSYGFAYTTSGETLRLHDGTLAAGDLAGWTAFEKAGAGVLNASAVTSWPGNLTLSTGAFSAQNAIAQTFTVAGALTLKGGAKLVVDLTTTGSDSFAAQSVAFEDADAAHPVEIVVKPMGVTELGESDACTVIAGVAEGDLARFKLVTGLPVQLAVRNGNLVLVARAQERTLPAGYTPLAYIASTCGQYIKTGIDGYEDMLVEMDFGGVIYTEATVLFGASAWAGNAFLFNMQSNKFYFHDPSGVAMASVQADVDYRFWVGGGKAILAAAGGETVMKGVTNSLSLADRELAIFCLNNGTASRMSAYRLHGMKIMEADGRRVRDFVPCRNPEGEAGLWDFVSGTFFRNAGTGCFLTADDSSVFLSWVQSSGSQYVVTDLQGLANTAVDFRFSHATYKNQTTFFGEDKWTDSGFLFCLQNNNLQFWAQGVNLLAVGSYNPETRYLFHKGTDLASLHVENSTGDSKNLSNIVSKTTDKRISVFGLSTGGYCASFRFYDMKVWASEGGTLQGDLRPYRMADGRIGLYNVVTDTFYPNKGSSFLAWGGIAYTLDANVLRVHEGTLAGEDVAGRSGVVKTGRGRLEASAVTSYPAALTLEQGEFSVQDGVARQYAIGGVLTLKGGARLSLDVTSEGCDTFAASDVVFDSSATAENPVDIVVDASIAALEDGAALRLFGDADSFQPGDEAKFAVRGFPAQLRVVNGALVMEPKRVGVSEWIGRCVESRWSMGLNWLEAAVPEAGASVLFNGTGVATVNDFAGGLRVNAVTFGTQAGGFVHGGREALAVVTAITNFSAAAQTFTLPMTLGVPEGVFSIDTAGPLALVGGVAADRATLVKTGAGELTIDDTAIAQAGRVDVAEGVLKLNVTGRQTGASTGGEIHVANGARFDVNVEFTNADSLATGEAAHGKTIYFEGDGPDGAGALYNSNLGDGWGATFSRLVLTGDASIGGGFMSVRPLAGSAAGTSVTAVEGGHTLTTRFPTYHAQPPDFDQCEFALKQLDVRGGLQFSYDLTGTITNGIHLYEGAALNVVNSCVLHEGIPLVADTGTSRLATFSNGTVLKGVFTVNPNATFEFNNANAVAQEGDVALAGTMRCTGTGVVTLSGTLRGNGVLTGRNIRFGGTATRWEIEMNDEGAVSKVDLDGMTDAAFFTGLAAIDVLYSGENPAGQVLRLGPAGNLTADQAAKIALTVRNQADAEIKNCWLEVAEGNLSLHVDDPGLVRTAVWAGGADSALDDPAVWVCSNDYGRVTNGLPLKMTRVFLPDGSVFNCPNGTSFPCLSVALPRSIGGDCDWRGLGANLNITNTIALNGHKLYLDRFVGNGKITDGEYQVLDYIESTGNQYVCTGADGNETTLVELVYSHVVYKNSAPLFAEGEWSWNDFIFCAQYDYFEYCSDRTDLLAFADYDSTIPYTLKTSDYNANDRSVRVAISTNGVEIVSRRVNNRVGTSVGKREIALFSMNTGVSSHASQYRFHSMKILEANGTVVRDLVPARRVSDGALGVIDVAHGNAFMPQRHIGSTTDSVIAGPIRPSALVAGGEVHLCSDVAVVNSSVTLEGTLKFVKEGSGTFTASKTGQTYAGGNDIQGGTFVCGDCGSAHVYGWDGATNVVRAGTVFDLNQKTNHYGNVFMLDGGTLKNTTGASGSLDAWLAHVVLTADSTIEGKNFGFVAPNWEPTTLAMNGHTLYLRIQGGVDGFFYMANLSVTGGGTISGATGGYLVLGGNAKRVKSSDDSLASFSGEGGKYVFAPTTTLEMPAEGAALFDRSTEPGQIRFLNYASTYNWNFNIGTGPIDVTGRFTPTGPKWHSVRLMDGATLDLSGVNGVWYSTCTYTRAGSGTAKLVFDPEASIIRVDLGNRRVPNGRVVAWTQEERPNGIKFRPVPGDRTHTFIVKDDGLYVQSGLTLFLR